MTTLIWLFAKRNLRETEEDERATSGPEHRKARRLRTPHRWISGLWRKSSPPRSGDSGTR